MAVTLEPMSAELIGDWLALSAADHVAQRIAAGDHPERARRDTEEMSARLFPGGAPAPGQCVFQICEDGVPVGSLWIGVAERPTDWYVWSVDVDASARGRGIGRQAMQLGEDVARSAGAIRMGLNVFGSNVVARGLYESLGYEVTALQMSKPLN